jgi:NAD(P)-dependent dehydrogenase (short-subunit alcohol dehydrogenase family)
VTEASRQRGQPQVAPVTGGAGGIGAAICSKLSGLGYRLVVVDLDLAAAQAVAAKVGGAAFAADVSDHAKNRAIVDFARQTLRAFPAPR